MEVNATVKNLKVVRCLAAININESWAVRWSLSNEVCINAVLQSLVRMKEWSPLCCMLELYLWQAMTEEVLSIMLERLVWCHNKRA